jgi:hypothetical protein
MEIKPVFHQENDGLYQLISDSSSEDEAPMTKSRRVISKASKSKKKRRQQRRKEVSLISFNVEPQDSYQMNVEQNSPKRNSNNVSTLYFLGKTFQRYLPALKNEILSSFMRPFSLF